MDVESLLTPVSEESPCGDDLEYEGVSALEQLAEGKPEQEIGGVFVPAQEPDWKEVQRDAEGLAARTKDLRVLSLLALALLRTRGFPGFRDGLTLLRGVVERFWDCLYPPLDPDDNDPVFRVNALAMLGDPQRSLRAVREAPLVAAKGIGQFSLRDIAVAAGEVAPAEDQEVPTPALIDGAFTQADPDDVQAMLDAVQGARAALQETESLVLGHVGAGNAPDLEPLSRALREVEQAILARAPGLVAEEAAAPDGLAPEAGPAAPRRAAAPPGEIQGRDDVVRALERIVDYYRREEPSSPVPILLERAKRLVPMDFMTIMQDLAPGALSEVETIRGPLPSDDED